MIKKLLYFALACGMLAGCNKEIPGIADEVGNDGNGNYEVGTEMVSVTFKLNVKGQRKTKALAIGALDEDAIDRIDVYEYNSGNQGYWVWTACRTCSPWPATWNG